MYSFLNTYKVSCVVVIEIIFFTACIVVTFMNFIYSRRKKRYKIKFTKVKENKYLKDKTIWVYDVLLFIMNRVSNCLFIPEKIDTYKIKKAMNAMKNLNLEMKSNFNKNDNSFYNEVNLTKQFIDLLNCTQNNFISLTFDYEERDLNIKIPNFIIFESVAFMSMYNFDKNIDISLFIKLKNINDIVTIAIEDTGTGLDDETRKLFYNQLKSSILNKKIYKDTKIKVYTSLEEGIKLLITFHKLY